MTSGIYKIQHIASGRLYIGSSVDAITRMRKHREKLNRGEHENKALQNGWGKYGKTAFEFSLLIICSKQDLILYEQRAIDAFKASTKPFGYNIRKDAATNAGIPSTRLSYKSGERFGRLVLVSQQGIGTGMWLCKCDCGNETTIRISSVRHGNTSSCGCYRKEKLSKLKTKHKVGDKFNRLTLVSLHHRNPNKGSAAHYWLCKCECGNTKISNVTAVKRGDIKSCGCYQADMNRARAKAKKLCGGGGGQ